MKIYILIAFTVLIILILLLRKYSKRDKRSNYRIYTDEVRSLFTFKEYPLDRGLKNKIFFYAYYFRNEPPEKFLVEESEYLEDKINAGSDPARNKDFQLIIDENKIHLNFWEEREPLIQKWLTESKDLTEDELEKKLFELDKMKVVVEKQNLKYKTDIEVHLKKVRKHLEWAKSPEGLQHYKYQK